MKRNHPISSLLVVIGLTIGILALSTSRLQVPVLDSGGSKSDKIYGQAEKSDESGQKSELKAIEAVPSTPQSILIHHFFLLEVLPESEDESSEESVEERSSAGSKALRVLFRLIISPNAP